MSSSGVTHKTFDRNDINNTHDIDIISWIKREMQIKLDDEIARALQGDIPPKK